MKKITGIILAATLTTSTLTTLTVEAKTTYKIKSGKLVNAKTGKVVKGFKTYKKVLYKNGKKFKGLRNNKFYKNGKLTSGTYKGIKYRNGVVFNGKSTDGKYYVKGKVANGRAANGLFYAKGQLFTGDLNGVLYADGKIIVSTNENTTNDDENQTTLEEIEEQNPTEDSIINESQGETITQDTDIPKEETSTTDNNDHVVIIPPSNSSNTSSNNGSSNSNNNSNNTHTSSNTLVKVENRLYKDSSTGIYYFGKEAKEVAQGSYQLRNHDADYEVLFFTNEGKLDYVMPLEEFRIYSQVENILSWYISISDGKITDGYILTSMDELTNWKKERAKCLELINGVKGVNQKNFLISVVEKLDSVYIEEYNKYQEELKFKAIEFKLNHSDLENVSKYEYEQFTDYLSQINDEKFKSAFSTYLNELSSKYLIGDQQEEKDFIIRRIEMFTIENINKNDYEHFKKYYIDEIKDEEFKKEKIAYLEDLLGQHDELVKSIYDDIYN